MIKSFLILLSFSTLLFSSQQILLVVSDDFNTSKARLFCFEDELLIYKNITVNIGKNGLGWGLGLSKIKHQEDEPLKYEGDKKAPAGIFKLTKIFGYKKSVNFKMPYLYTSQNLICVDDSNSKYYNQIISMKGDEKSFEFMKREDEQYKLGIVVEHNKKALNRRGSCIFIHIEKGVGKGTAGCTSMSYQDIKKVVEWLDSEKEPLLIQVPKKYMPKILELYPSLNSWNNSVKF